MKDEDTDGCVRQWLAMLFQWVDGYPGHDENESRNTCFAMVNEISG